MAAKPQALKRKYASDKNGRLIMYCEYTSETYTPEFIAKLLNEEGRRCGLFEARAERLGVRVATRCRCAGNGG